MKRFTLRPSASDDIDEIWRYTDLRWGEAQADAYVREIEAAIRRLATAPPPSSRCDAIKQGYLRLRAGSHFVFAIPIDQELIVIRVLHQSMDFGEHLQDS